MTTGSRLLARTAAERFWRARQWQEVTIDGRLIYHAELDGGEGKLVQLQALTEQALESAAYHAIMLVEEEARDA